MPAMMFEQIVQISKTGAFGLRLSARTRPSVSGVRQQLLPGLMKIVKVSDIQKFKLII